MNCLQKLQSQLQTTQQQIQSAAEQASDERIRALLQEIRPKSSPQQSSAQSQNRIPPPEIFNQNSQHYHQGSVTGLSGSDPLPPDENSGFIKLRYWAEIDNHPDEGLIKIPNMAPEPYRQLHSPGPPPYGLHNQVTARMNMGGFWPPPELHTRLQRGRSADSVSAAKSSQNRRPSLLPEIKENVVCNEILPLEVTDTSSTSSLSPFETGKVMGKMNKAISLESGIVARKLPKENQRLSHLELVKHKVKQFEDGEADQVGPWKLHLQQANKRELEKIVSQNSGSVLDKASYFEDVVTSPRLSICSSIEGDGFPPTSPTLSNDSGRFWEARSAPESMQNSYIRQRNGSSQALPHRHQSFLAAIANTQGKDKAK